MPKAPQWLDGPKLAELVDERLMGRSPLTISAAFDRRLRYWRDGEAARYVEADKWLIQLPSPIHEWELEGVWRDHPLRGQKRPPRPKRRVISEATKKKVARLYKTGAYTYRQLGEKYEVDKRTAERWVKAYG